MEQRRIIPLSSFTGLNTRQSALEMPESDSPWCVNVDFRDGGISPRWNFPTMSGVPADTYWQGVYAGLYENLVYGSGFTDATATVYTWDGSENTWGWTAIKTGLVGYRAYPSFASYNGLDIMVNGFRNDIPQKWSGTVWGDLGGTPPRANQVLVWRNRVWLAGLGPGYEGEIRYSDLENPESGWSQFIRVSKDSVGHSVVGMAAPAGDNGALIVFCDKSIYQFEGFTRSTFQVEPVNTEVGCTDWKSIVVADGLMYWHDRTGIYCSPDGGISVNPISWKIYPGLLEQVDLTSDVVGYELPDFKSIWWNFRGLKDNTVKPFLTRWIVYDYGQSMPTSEHREGRHVWTQYNRNSSYLEDDYTSWLGLTFGGSARLPDGRPKAIGGGRNFILDLSQHSGTMTRFSYKTKTFLLSGSWSVHSILRKIQVVLDQVGDAGADLSVLVYLDNSTLALSTETIDFNAVGSAMGTAVMGTATMAGEYPANEEIWYNQSCKSVQIEFRMTAATDLFKIHQVMLEMSEALSSR